jgi:hypothetical protein
LWPGVACCFEARCDSLRSIISVRLSGVDTCMTLPEVPVFCDTHGRHVSLFFFKRLAGDSGTSYMSLSSPCVVSLKVSDYIIAIILTPTSAVHRLWRTIEVCKQECSLRLRAKRNFMGTRQLKRPKRRPCTKRQSRYASRASFRNATSSRAKHFV